MKKPPKKKNARWGAKAFIKSSKYVRDYYKKLEACQHAPKEARPSPRYYYTPIFGNLPNHVEWAPVKCCFHSDSRPSLSINLKSGGFFCFGCGAKGGDLIDFHRQHSDVGFIEAVAQLKAMQKKELKCQ